MSQQMTQLQPIAHEASILIDESRHLETYIFEPDSSEKLLGYLYITGETAAGEGLGGELLDLAVQALQREYYRDPARNLNASFESALHQANLILHDTVESGYREWMTDFHVAVVALAGNTLNTSVAGLANVLLSRRGRVTNITQGLASFPVTHALRTFSQVSSGTLAEHDTLFVNSPSITTTLDDTDLAHLSSDPSSATISARLQNLYVDKSGTEGAASIVVSLLPKAAAQQIEAEPAQSQRPGMPISVTPRTPLKIQRTVISLFFSTFVKALKAIGSWLAGTIWPLLREGSKAGAKASASVSTKGWEKIKSGQMPNKPKMPKIPSVKDAVGGTSKKFKGMPKTSKVFAVVALVLAIALLTSLLLLRGKRAEDATIQQASEILHDAQTKQAAAETALIYDNRDQARNFLKEAQADVEQLQQMQLYVDETTVLVTEIDKITDRLQKISRASSIDTAVVGDFAESLDSQALMGISTIGEKVYAWEANTNAILSMDSGGQVEIVNETSAGVGFLEKGIANQADQTITFTTNEPSVAIYDAKDQTLLGQEIQFSAEDSVINSLAVFGNRLYVFDETVKNIIGFSKTLRGFSSNSPWINDDSAPRDIVDIAVDGNIFTLHADGSINQLFKGAVTDFVAEPVEPSLSGATRLLTSEDLVNIYVLDKDNQRVVVYDKDGALIKQIMLDVAHNLVDATVSTDEEKLFVLDGTRLLAVPIKEVAE